MIVCNECNTNIFFISFEMLGDVYVLYICPVCLNHILVKQTNKN